MTPAPGRIPPLLLVLLALGVGLAAGAYLTQRFRSGAESGQSASAAPVAATRFHCPMHPAMISDRPGDCPICGMRLVPLQASTVSGTEEAPLDADQAGGAAGPPVAGQAVVRVPLLKQQLIGVRTTAVVRAPLLRSLRAVGRVTADETRLHHVHTKVEGWVDRLDVNTTGVKVEKGQPLLSLYSPELLATQQEYLLAVRSRRSASGPPDDAGAVALVESARRRLLLFDMTPAQIEAIERSGEAARTVTLYAPSSGYVMQRNVTQGERITPETPLLDIADLSRLWVIASIYEYELPFVRVGQEAAMSLSYVPGRQYRGRVALVYPTLEGSTRTVQVRLEFDNPDLELRPEMYVQVAIECDLGPRLQVPTSAVLSSGERDLVFVARGGGTFEPREVRLGLRLPEATEILSGLEAGEEVVVSGNFLIDSESKLKAALESVGAPAAAPEHRH